MDEDAVPFIRYERYYWSYVPKLQNATLVAELHALPGDVNRISFPELQVRKWLILGEHAVWHILRTYLHLFLPQHVTDRERLRTALQTLTTSHLAGNVAAHSHDRWTLLVIVHCLGTSLFAKVEVNRESYGKRYTDGMSSNQSNMIWLASLKWPRSDSVWISIRPRIWFAT